MSDLNAFKRAVRDCIENLEERGAEPRTVLADSSGDWFYEDTLELTDFLHDEMRERGVGFTDTPMDTERVIVVGEIDDEIIQTCGTHFELYRDDDDDRQS